MQGFGGVLGYKESVACVGQCVLLCGSEWRRVGSVRRTPTAVTNCNTATIRRKGGERRLMETALASKD